MSRNSGVTGSNPHPNPPQRNVNKEVQKHLSKWRKQIMGAGKPRKGTPYKFPKIKTKPIDVLKKGLRFMRGN